MTGIIIFLIGVSSIMSWVMAFTGIPAAISGVMLGISSNKYVILLIINVILLIVGTFMDMTPACLIFTPIFLPICQAVGMNTIHFWYYDDIQLMYRNNHTWLEQRFRRC